MATEALLRSAPGPQGLIGFQEGSSFNQESETGWRQAHPIMQWTWIKP